MECLTDDNHLRSFATRCRQAAVLRYPTRLRSRRQQLERLAMIQWGIPDIRHLIENDVRFLGQFVFLQAAALLVSLHQASQLVRVELAEAGNGTPEGLGIPAVN